MCLTELSVQRHLWLYAYGTRGKLGMMGLHSHSRGKERERGKSMVGRRPVEESWEEKSQGLTEAKPQTSKVR